MKRIIAITVAIVALSITGCDDEVKDPRESMWALLAVKEKQLLAEDWKLFYIDQKVNDGQSAVFWEAVFVEQYKLPSESQRRILQIFDDFTDDKPAAVVGEYYLGVPVTIENPEPEAPGANG